MTISQYSPTSPFLVFNALYLQIIDSPELWAENSDQSSTLIIAEAKPQHTGRYTVVVKDRKSSAQHTLTISVIGKTIHTLRCHHHMKGIFAVSWASYRSLTHQSGQSLRPPALWSPSSLPRALCCPGQAPATTGAVRSWVTWLRWRAKDVPSLRLGRSLLPSVRAPRTEWALDCYLSRSTVSEWEPTTKWE